MRAQLLRSDGLLLVAAAIWGFAFVAQRAGMEHVGPFTFNAVRFALGSSALLVLLAARRHRSGRKAPVEPDYPLRRTIRGGFLAGAVLYLGASLQQIGIVYTTAGKAGFITGLYVVIVPLAGLAWGHRPGTGAWVGVCLAAFGLYMLSVREAATAVRGDALVLGGAFFWAIHVLLIGRLAGRFDALRLAAVQFATCSVLSGVSALLTETLAAESLRRAGIPILYGGLMSVGIAYTLQVVAQRRVHPTHAAIILSTESVFAALGGRVVLGEALSVQALLGCGLMLAGVITSAVTRDSVLSRK